MRQRFTVIILLLLMGLSCSLNMAAQNQAPSEWQTCSACHTIGKGKLVGPDLYGVNEKYSEDWLIRFIRSSQTMIQSGDPQAVKIWEEYNKIPMPDNDLTDEQIRGILAYISAYDPEAAVAAAPVIAEEAPEEHVAKDIPGKFGPGNTQPTFIIFLILFILAIVDVAFTRVIRARFIHFVIILVSVFVCGEIIVVEARALGRQEGYSPDQPVWFSHKVHAGQNKIDCLYCHHAATESKSAGIPDTRLCMNCHNVVRKGTVTGETEIARVISSWETEKPIEWIRAHNLPDHVFFSHAQHVNAGKLECRECHGPVENMDRIMQVKNLGMGWCIHCHRQTEVQFDSNSFYRKYTGLQQSLKEGRISRVTAEDIGANNCQMCHY
ncbi:MAG: c-type cytochrome [Bacteroidales bacterium]|nr:c-type cytochrome [Bacteroidales bacterium]